jgi:hypothetical protein
MPTQQRLRRHDQPAPVGQREDLRQRREEGTIGRPNQGAWLLPTENSKLMPQHEKFDVLGKRTAPAPGKQPQHRRERHVSERERSIRRCLQTHDFPARRPGTEVLKPLREEPPLRPPLPAA